MDIQSWPFGNTAALATEPNNLLPGRILGWPQGTQRDNTPATDILSQAVAWWDTAAYQNGDRFFRNRGVGGELLDLRLGSSTTPNTNDPTYLPQDSLGYVYLPGTSGNYMSVPDENALDITGDLDFRVRVAMDSWRPTNNSSFFCKNTLAEAQPTYRFTCASTGVLRLTLSFDGSARTNYDSTTTIDTNTTVKWVRVTRVQSSGEIKFFTSDDAVTWTQLGNTVTGPTSAIATGTSEVFIGTGNLFFLGGRIYRVQILSGVDGTTVLDLDCDAITSGSVTSFTATTGQTVTIFRASPGGRKTVAIPAARNGGRGVFLLSTDDWFEIPLTASWQHQLLNFGQGDSLTVLAVCRQWATPVTTASVIGKTDTGTNESRWNLRQNSNVNSLTILAGEQGGTVKTANSPSVTLGTLGVYFGVIDRNADILYAYANASVGTASTLDRLPSLANLLAVRIGRSALSYQDMEFQVGAVWRRVLTAAEVSAITSYYTVGG